jgi:predicted ABC-class ATPase
MRTQEDLRRTLQRIDGRGYKAYKDIRGEYDFHQYQLIVDHVQGDPFAAPSRIIVRVPMERAAFPEDLWNNRVRRTALCDCIARQFDRAIRAHAKGRRGMGTSGVIDIDVGRQEILERTAVLVNPGHVEVRFVVGLPAAGRSILGREASAIFFYELPRLVTASLIHGNLDGDAVRLHVDVAEDQEVLRQKLDEHGLVSFVADGSVLPRRSGIDDRPLEHNAVPLAPPPELEVEITLPHRGTVKGMGIPKGVTLIVGGGFHGKSTLLKAVERGIYNHIPGDGRDCVATDSTAVKIRAEDGRRIEKVDISPFITNLPFGKDTTAFQTDNASGSTSQAANIMEALEAGSRLLLIDEDTSATNFMVRDERMQELVAKEKEPITPFVDKVRKLFTDYGVSTILVMGGSGDYFDVADTVIMMDHYQPHRVTERARSIAAQHRSLRKDEGGDSFGDVTPRQPLVGSFDPSRGKRDVKIDAKGLHTILYGRTPIDLSCLEQLVDISQTRAIGLMIHYYSRNYLQRSRSLKDGMQLVTRDIEQEGLDCLLPYRLGNIAIPRLFEAVAALNRMRTLVVELVRSADRGGNSGHASRPDTTDAGHGRKDGSV